MNRGLTEGAVPTAEEAIAATKRIVELKLEYDNAQEEVTRITAEAKQNWEIMNRVFSQFGGVGRQRSQAQTSNPRPVGIKLLISAGRAIATAVKKGNNLEQTKAAALKAAGVVGKKHGLASIPLDVVATIEGRAQKHFGGASA